MNGPVELPALGGNERSFVDVAYAEIGSDNAGRGQRGIDKGEVYDGGGQGALS